MIFLRMIIAGREFTQQVLRQIVDDVNYNFNQLKQQVLWGVRSASTTSTIVLEENSTFIRADTTAGNITLTLPLASTVPGFTVIVRKMVAANTLTVESVTWSAVGLSHQWFSDGITWNLL